MVDELKKGKIIKFIDEIHKHISELPTLFECNLSTKVELCFPNLNDFYININCYSYYCDIYTIKIIYDNKKLYLNLDFYNITNEIFVKDFLHLCTFKTPTF